MRKFKRHFRFRTFAKIFKIRYKSTEKIFPSAQWGFSSIPPAGIDSSRAEGREAGRDHRPRQPCPWPASCELRAL